MASIEPQNAEKWAQDAPMPGAEFEKSSARADQLFSMIYSGNRSLGNQPSGFAPGALARRPA